MTITHSQEQTKWGGTRVRAGDHTLAIITRETDPAAVAKFIALCEAQDALLTQMGIEYEQAVQRNAESNGHGRSWPIFGRRDRLVGRLLRQAGIIDS